MDEEVLACIQAAVNLARDRQLRTVVSLKAALLNAGFELPVINEAVKFWADYEASKKAA